MSRLHGRSRIARMNGNAANGKNGNGVHAPVGGAAAVKVETARVPAGVVMGDGAGAAIPRGLEDSPSGLGVEGVKHAGASAAPMPGLRDRLGRFLPGNLGGPGNPFGRRVALLRSAFLECVTPEKMAALVEKVYQSALAGDRDMTKLLFSYLLGKPVTAANPDRIELEEWGMRREQPPTAELLTDQGRMPAIIANAIGQSIDGVKKQNVLNELNEPGVPYERAKRAEQAARAERRQQKKVQRQRRKRSG